jgi:hypothetical protein
VRGSREAGLGGPEEEVESAAGALFGERCVSK